MATAPAAPLPFSGMYILSLLSYRIMGSILAKSSRDAAPLSRCLPRLILLTAHIAAAMHDGENERTVSFPSYIMR